MSEEAANVEAQERSAAPRDPPPHGGRAPTPQDELVQALAQLLVNAGQATGAAPNQVRVAADLLDVTRVQVIVSDTGVGMDAATRARAFEPFFTTRAVGAGRGLGLSVCRGIVGAAGGSLELQSAPGHGTLVRMVLPVYRPPR